MRVVDPEHLHALLDPVPDHIAQRQPQSRLGILGIEVDVDDVLILLRRVLRIFDGAVRAPGEPAWVLLEPGVILRALDGEIEGDFQAVFTRRCNQLMEVVQCAQFGMNGVVPTILAADGIGAARIVRTGQQAVVRPLAVLAPDRVDWREIQHVEAHVANGGQALVHVAEGAVAIRVVGFRAREQLIPAGELRQRALDIQRIHSTATAMFARIRRGHRSSRVRRKQQRNALIVGMGHTEAVHQIVEHRAVFTLGAGRGLFQQQPPFFQFQMHRHASGVFFRQLVAIGFENIPPGLDDELMLGHLRRGELALPGVIAEQLQSRATPTGFALLTPAHGGGKLVMPVGENLAGYDYRLADDRLGSKAPFIQHRQGGFDGDARHLQGFFESRVNRRGRLCITHRKGLLGRGFGLPEPPLDASTCGSGGDRYGFRRLYLPSQGTLESSAPSGR